MDILTKIWIISISFAITIYLFEKIRKQKYIVKFSIPWFLTFLIIIILAIFPKLIDKIAMVLGIKEPINAIFFIAICILVNNIINLSFSMSESKKQSIRMVQEIALLKKNISINEEIELLNIEKAFQFIKNSEDKENEFNMVNEIELIKDSGLANNKYRREL